MSDNPAPKPKSKLGRLLVIGAAVIGLLGAGAAAGVFAAQSGWAGGARGAAHDGPETSAPNAPAPEIGDNGEYETTYVELSKEFTANLRDPNRYLQVGLGIATHYGEPVTKAIKENEPAIRSAILGILAEHAVDDLASVAGKEALQRRLRGCINDVLEAKTKFGGVSHVYFTSFVIQ